VKATDELLTIAELSVALIGFSGLISVFRTRAAAELGRYSDAELSDLDLTRPAIPAAVRQGRPGTDDRKRRAA